MPGYKLGLLPGGNWRWPHGSGDFLPKGPIGGNGDAYRNEKHPPQGETAGNAWQLVGEEKNGAVTTLTLEMKTTARIGKVTKKLQLVDGHNVVYSSHRLSPGAGE